MTKYFNACIIADDCEVKKLRDLLERWHALKWCAGSPGDCGWMQYWGYDFCVVQNNNDEWGFASCMDQLNVSFIGTEILCGSNLVKKLVTDGRITLALIKESPDDLKIHRPRW